MPLQSMKRTIRIFSWFLALHLIGCTPLVRTDLKSLQKDPEKYQGKKVIIQTDLKSVLENPADYLGRKIELMGYVKYYGHRGPRGWSFSLKDINGREIICYEREYRVESWTVPCIALRRAERNREQIIVVGKLEKGLELELDWIEYQGQHIDTDFKPPKPPRICFPFP